jgi:hypothetical protein
MLSNVKLVSAMLDCDAKYNYCNDQLLKLADRWHEDAIGEAS